MNIKARLALSVASAAIGAASLPVVAQTSSASPDVAAQDTSGDQNRTEVVDPTGVPGTSNSADVVVVGIRGSVTSANKKKRDAKQIVDSVVSEDVGKLPDNNVVEALSRVTGVQIERAQGRGQELSIRGLSGVQTTINGNNANQGEGRSISLADIPAELVKSLDVYKTRSPDQVEGSIAGTVNVELRRPLELAKGLTIAGSARGSYDNIADKVNPYVSMLVAQRFDTAIGEVGFLVNGAWARTNFFESYIESESPDVVCCAGTSEQNTAWDRLPANLKNIVLPFRAHYGLQEGRADQPSLNMSLQWKPNDNLDFVLEGTYIGSRGREQADRLYAFTREPGSTLSDITLMPDGVTVRSLTFSQADGNLPVGIDSTYTTSSSNTYTTNFETHWRSERADINIGMQYSWSDVGYYFVEHLTRPNNVQSATVDFVSNQYNRGAPQITFNGVDLTKVSSYGIERFQDNRGGSKNSEFASQVDLTLKIGDESLLRSFQSGVRFFKRNPNNYYGYRDGLPRVDGAFAPLSSLPGADAVSLTGPRIDGAGRWLRIPGQTVLANIAAIRSYIQATDPRAAELFSSVFPPQERGGNFRSSENTLAFYGMMNYGFDIGFPVDGIFGARYVNTWGYSTSEAYFPILERIDGQQVQTGERIDRVSSRANYVDILPSVTAVLHFTPKAQLRLSYSTNVQRPDFMSLRPFFRVDTNQTPNVVYAGNPDLKAQTEDAFDASAEYYFGRGGIVSLAGYYKKATGFFYDDRVEGQDLSIYGLVDRIGIVQQLRNAGDGEFIGLEGRVSTFFDFLPGIWKNFGFDVNGSTMIKARVEYPYPEDFPGAFDSTGTSKWTANAALFYDTPRFSARVAYNYRSPFRDFIWTVRPDYSFYTDATSRLDAAINFTPIKAVTLSLEGANLLGNDVYRYFGKENLLPLGVRVQARTVQGSVRFRF